MSEEEAAEGGRQFMVEREKEKEDKITEGTHERES